MNGNNKLILIVAATITIPPMISHAAVQITNGTDVPQGKYPFYTALGPRSQKIDANFGGQCGGALIAPNWVITAMHCIPPNTEMKVAVGSSDLSNPVSYQMANVLKVFYVEGMPDYPWVGKDIVLLKLDRNIILPPIQLSSTKPQSGLATVIGQGAMNESLKLPLTVKEVDIPVTFDEACNSSTLHKFNADLVPDKEFCAGSHNGVRRNILDGDSGGPLIQKINGQYRLIGIAVRLTTLDHTVNSPAIFTSINYYHAWIMDIIKNNQEKI